MATVGLASAQPRLGAALRRSRGFGGAGDRRYRRGSALARGFCRTHDRCGARRFRLPAGGILVAEDAREEIAALATLGGSEELPGGSVLEDAAV